MNYRNLGRTGLKVSSLCLGTMQWGWTASEEAGVAVMDAFAAAGGNFIDTADIYSRWAEGNPGGVSEEIIGRWMQSRGNRQQIVLATKARGRMWDGPNGEGLSRVHLVKACEDSLRRLQTDYIDLYQAHFFDADTPIEETMETLDLLVRQGKVRYAGCSNYPAWRLVQALWAADKGGWVRYDSLQPHYNLVHRGEFERELKDVCIQYGLGVIPYSPLAGGFLTGKYRRGPAGGQAGGAQSARAESVRSRYMNERGFAVLDALDAIAADRGVSVLQVSLAWLLRLEYVTAPIIGANTVEQLAESLGACAVALTAEEMARLKEASGWEQG
jgi:aryl-alcohol dehydrogenase-like predicted oxidoreductase